ncbi:MAG: winged helix-turn-helix transcriptional regulator [Comamonas sp.]|nr:winged helix-turn-helix transcriptional regulator [Comamonas sp.]
MATNSSSPPSIAANDANPIPNEPPADFAFIDDYLSALLSQASALIAAQFHTQVQAAGFSVTEWRVLATLASRNGMSTGGLAQIALSKQPTVTRLLDRMEARGYVQRYPHSSDRRITMVRITAAGSAIATRLMACAKAHEQQVLQPLGSEQTQALKATLRSIIDMRRRGGGGAAKG